MAHVNKVRRSIENTDGTRCIDVFIRPDGMFGYEYRRAPEDPRGWAQNGAYSALIFSTESAAFDDAITKVTWLRQGK